MKQDLLLYLLLLLLLYLLLLLLIAFMNIDHTSNIKLRTGIFKSYWTDSRTCFILLVTSSFNFSFSNLLLFL